MSDDPSPTAFLLGAPTASGKSAVALRLAQRFGLEIVSADAMQVYRGLDVGTAKPSAADRARVPHHGLDLVDPDQPFSVAEWVAVAEDAILDAYARGVACLVVGGTGYEAGARSRVWAEGGGGQEIELFSSMGDDIENLDHIGAWESFSADLSGFTTATLHFELDANSGSEAIYVDNIQFSNIPAPGAVALLGVAGLVARRRRRA